ncbi:MAG: zinc ribbon domain-containing protein [Lachnospiraceae bacterium]|nr:zinc ribbon domain-containing protein [Lachnospiraceae bacterium]
MFCPKCGAQLPDGSVFCSACGAQIAQQANPVAEPVVQQAAVAASVVPKANTAAKFNILGGVLTVLLFFTLFMPFQSAGYMFITKWEGWLLILAVLAAGFFIVMKMDSLFMMASAAAVCIVFLAMLMIAFGVHGSGSKDLDELMGALSALSGTSIASTAGLKTPGFGVTFALTCSLGMLLSPIINRLFAKRK